MSLPLIIAAIALPLISGPIALAGITFIPDPIAIQLGPIPVYWYGVCYAAGLAGVYWILTRLAPRYGQDPEHVGSGLLIVGIAALLGGRLYHVIDQWALYADDPLSIILPPYSGLGVYGGIATGTLAALIYIRRNNLPFWTWADIIAPGLFLMQAVGRWGNFFNQELYGTPTELPWGIAIDCAHRTIAYPCSTLPFETTFFHPLFAYESLSGIAGMAALLWLGSRRRPSLRAGDLLLIFFIWYAVVRFTLETFRSENWTFFGVPTAQLISIGLALGAFLVLVYRHRLPREAIEDHRVDDVDDEDDLDDFDDDFDDDPDSDFDDFDDDGGGDGESAEPGPRADEPEPELRTDEPAPDEPAPDEPEPDGGPPAART